MTSRTKQWDLIGRFLPEPVRSADGRGRPWRENRAVLNGILWILRTHRRFQQWVRVGVLRSILRILAQALHDQGHLDLQEVSARRNMARDRRSRPAAAAQRGLSAAASLLRDGDDTKARRDESDSRWTVETITDVLHRHSGPPLYC